jgi:hypothetical protein
MSLFTSDQSNSTSKKSLFSKKDKKPLILSGDLQQDKEALEAIEEAERMQSISGWIRKEYSKCRGQLDPIKRQWYMNMAFYKGDQYVDFVDNMLINIPAPEKRTRLVINRIKPVVRTEVSRMTSQKPSASVVPASNESRDVEAAKAAESVFESLRQRLHLEKVIREAAWWCSVTGTSFIKTYWDPDYMENTGVTNELGEETTIEGDHCYHAVSPFNVLVPNLLVTDIEEQPYVLNVFTKPMEWVSTHYPELVKKEGWSPKTVTEGEVMEPRYLNLKGADGEKAQPNSCLIIEAWIKPGNTQLMPKGGRVVVIDEEIVDISEDGLPYAHGEYPFAKMESVQTGTFYAASVIEDLIPIQREINRTRSQLIEARNLMSKPGVFYRSNSIDPNKWTSATAQLIEVKPGMEFPQPIPLPNIPSYVPQLESGFLADMEDISGQHQVSKGSAPPGVSSGTAIQFLQESDNSFMYTVHASLEECVQKIAKHSIHLAIQYWDSARLVKYVGRNNQVSAKYLSQADLKGGTDIRIEGGSSLPESKAARIAMFSDFMARGYLPVDQGLKLMNLASMSQYYELADVDENQAIRENIAMSELIPEEVAATREKVAMQIQGMLPMGIDPMMNPMASQLAEIANEPIIPVHEWDNHDVHIEVIERHMKSQEYEDYPDEIKNEFELHRQAHLDAQMQAAFKQMFQQMNDPNADPNNPGGNPAGGGGVPNEGGTNQFSQMNSPVDTQTPPQ